jgi:OTU domain-containing protein 5
MAKERDHYSQFVTEDFNEYIARKRKDGCFGNNLEIQAIGEIFNRPVHVYSYSADPINIFHGNYDTKDNPPIRLSYHGGNHYNAVVDPYEATVGVGLGMPGLIPGLAEKQQMDKAIAMSEEHMYTKSTVDLQISSDREATEYELEKVVRQASEE